MTKPQALFPGDWIEYAYHLKGPTGHSKRLGMILEIKEDLTIVVSTFAEHSWDEPYRWSWTRINVRDILKVYPRFCVLPIPGKIEGFDDEL